MYDSAAAGAQDILDGARAAIEVTPPLRHRRWCHDVADSPATEHGATAERHDRIPGPMYFQHRDWSRRGTRERGTQRPCNRRDGGDDVGASHASRVTMNAPADIPVAKIRPRSMP